jgi:hypothetical protein
VRNEHTAPTLERRHETKESKEDVAKICYVEAVFTAMKSNSAITRRSLKQISTEYTADETSDNADEGMRRNPIQCATHEVRHRLVPPRTGDLISPNPSPTRVVAPQGRRHSPTSTAQAHSRGEINTVTEDLGRHFRTGRKGKPAYGLLSYAY